MSQDKGISGYADLIRPSMSRTHGESILNGENIVNEGINEVIRRQESVRGINPYQFNNYTNESSNEEPLKYESDNFVGQDGQQDHLKYNPNGDLWRYDETNFVHSGSNDDVSINRTHFNLTVEEKLPRKDYSKFNKRENIMFISKNES
jgi:hypothetical protein